MIAIRAAALGALLLAGVSRTEEIRVVGPGDTETVHTDSPPAMLALVGGTLVLMGDFDRFGQHPAEHPTSFPNLTLLGTPRGTLRYRNCALVPGDPDSARFDSLPVAFDSLRIEFENCWLHGQGSGVITDGSHRGGLRAVDTWFTLADTAVISADHVFESHFERCRFAFGSAGVAIHDARLVRFEDCEFVSLDLAVSMSGAGRAEFRDCLFQSCGTMLQLSDEVEALLDTCSFHETGLACVAGVDPGDSLVLVASALYFDPIGAPLERRVVGLPDSLLADTLTVAPRQAVRPVVIEILVDDSEPLESGGGSIGIIASVSLRDEGGAPFEPRGLSLFALPLGTGADTLAAFHSDPAFRSQWLRSRHDLGAWMSGGHLAGDRLTVPLPADTLQGPGWLLLATVDDDRAPREPPPGGPAHRGGVGSGAMVPTENN
jgi:hypothetical protein